VHPAEGERVEEASAPTQAGEIGAFANASGIIVSTSMASIAPTETS